MFRTRVKVPYRGEYEIDIGELVGWARERGCKPVLLPIIEAECRGRLAEALFEKFGHRVSPYQLRGMQKRAETRLNDLLPRLDRNDPAFTPAEIADGREFFRQNQRDLSKLIGGRPKDPIPDRPDIQIMAQSSKLCTGTGFVFSNDVHFWGYHDLIKQRWKLSVHRTVDIPPLLDEWSRR